MLSIRIIIENKDLNEAPGEDQSPGAIFFRPVLGKKLKGVKFHCSQTGTKVNNELKQKKASATGQGDGGLSSGAV
jgi:hypothetical protein